MLPALCGQPDQLARLARSASRVCVCTCVCQSVWKLATATRRNEPRQRNHKKVRLAASRELLNLAFYSGFDLDLISLLLYILLYILTYVHYIYTYKHVYLNVYRYRCLKHVRIASPEAASRQKMLYFLIGLTRSRQPIRIPSAKENYFQSFYSLALSLSFYFDALSYHASSLSS